MNAVKAPITFMMPYRMTAMAHKVMEIMERDGGISHLIATHYNIGDVRREIARIREAIPRGFTVETIRTRKDAEGNQYTRWTLKKLPKADFRVNAEGECRMAA